MKWITLASFGVAAFLLALGAWQATRGEYFWMLVDFVQVAMWMAMPTAARNLMGKTK